MREKPQVDAGDGLQGSPEVCDDLGVPRRPPVPPAQTVAADLRRRLGAGEWDHGEQLPTVRELSEHYGHARKTISRALSLLADEGLIVITPNWGTHRAQ
jgi:DNA-binding GntR family transcriptional regulator